MLSDRASYEFTEKPFGNGGYEVGLFCQILEKWYNREERTTVQTAASGADGGVGISDLPRRQQDGIVRQCGRDAADTVLCGA